MSNHSKLPWVSKEVPTSAGTCFKVGPPEIVNGAHGAICLYDDHYQHNPCKSGEQSANAEFIVRACNAHDDLVAAATNAYQRLLALGDYRGRWTSDGQHELCALRDAIAAATGITEQETQEFNESEALIKAIILL